VAVVEETYAEFSARMHRKTAGRRVPGHLDFDVTYRCNLDCRHCYCNLPANDARAKDAELALEQIERILAEARDMGAFWILLTGGEPLVRPDFRDIYLACKRLGLVTTLFTNATLIDEEWAELIAAHRPFRVEVTIHGSRAEVHDGVTRTPGSFEKCLRGVTLLKKAGVRVGLKAMVLASNIHDMDGIAALAARMGLPFRMDPVVHARYPDVPHSRGGEPRRERIGAEEVLYVDRHFYARAEAWEKTCDHLASLSCADQTKVLSCGAGRSSLHLDPDGTARPCAMLRQVGWPLADRTVREVWERSIGDFLDEPYAGPDECRACTLGSLCGMCAGWSWVEHGDGGAKVDHLCAIARGRMALRERLRRGRDTP
jgi:radical SAM protein with 4Fe4S-binding SPASM domain